MIRTHLMQQSLQSHGIQHAVLAKLFDNPYWVRHWIRQEIVLSRTCTILHGHLQMPWQELVEISEWAFWSDFENDGLKIEIPGIGIVFRLGTLAEGYGKYGALLTLIKCIIQDTVCEDPRDKVFGIQSLLEARARIKIDYCLSVKDVLMEALCTYARLYHARGDHLWLYFARLAAAMGLRIEIDELERGMATYLEQKHEDVLVAEQDLRALLDYAITERPQIAND